MQVDVVIIGGGIAGLSTAAFLGEHLSVVVIESEPTLGYHATGRSAALYTECYGSTVIRRLAQASRPFLDNPQRPMLHGRGVLFTAPTGDESILDRLADEFTPLVPSLKAISSAEVAELCPLFPASLVAGGVYEPAAADIDVDLLQTTYVAMARSTGVEILVNAPVQSIDQRGEGWAIHAGDHRVEAATLVNASGAWGDQTASLAGVSPLGLKPLARSVFTFDPGADPRNWPMVIDAHEHWYIKPEGIHMIGSAASEIPTDPADVRAEEIDVALGIERINEASTLAIRSVKNTWAGLRTFAPDRVPAIGRDPRVPSFVWVVGQGGYGIKTSPALGQLAAAIVEDRPAPAFLADHGIDVRDLDPARLYGAVGS